MTDRTDNFNRADESPLGTPSDGGAAWNSGPYTTNVSTNRATGTAFWQCELDCGIATHYSQATFTTFKDSCGITARGSDLNNIILGVGRAAGTTVEIYKQVGSFTSIATGSATWADGDVIKLNCDSADLITLYQNGVSRASVTDSTGNTNTKGGLWANTAGAFYDNFSLVNNAAAGAPRPFRTPGLDGLASAGTSIGNRLE